jgi:hypothetical protein
MTGLIRTGHRLYLVIHKPVGHHFISQRLRLLGLECHSILLFPCNCRESVQVALRIFK